MYGWDVDWEGDIVEIFSTQSPQRKNKKSFTEKKNDRTRNKK